MDKRIFQRKLERIASGKAPRALDLFAGCGGLSLGFQSAGFEIRGAVELDEIAARTHAQNFHAGSSVHAMPVDISATSPEELASRLSFGPSKESVDVVIGGPPCQAFARVGRPKLREVEQHPEAFLHDARAKLYLQYLKYVEWFAPLAIVMENVPDALNHGGLNIAEEVCEVLSAKGYACGYTLMNAVHYGVPQLRERMVLIAYRSEVTHRIRFPKPSHWMRLPIGYAGTRAVALRTLRGREAGTSHYMEAPVPHEGLPRAISCEQAIGDLPPIYAREMAAAGTFRRHRQSTVGGRFGSRKAVLSTYSRTMQEWPVSGATTSGQVSGHAIRLLPRDFEIFARMPAGGQYPQAHAIAVEIFRERLQEFQAAGHRIDEGSDAYQKLWKSIVPPYDVGKFPNKWRKLDRDQPARTLLAHLGKDGYSHIHYDSLQARTISVREAARLQSFPDSFSFPTSLGPAFRQIGNAVPPLLAKAIAAEVKATLTALSRPPQGGEVREPDVAWA